MDGITTTGRTPIAGPEREIEMDIYQGCPQLTAGHPEADQLETYTLRIA